MEFSDPHEALRYHVTGAVERGEKEAIVEVPVNQRTRNLVPAVCIDCRQPMRIWGDWYYAEREEDGSAPIARMWGGYYTHVKDQNGRCHTA